MKRDEFLRELIKADAVQFGRESRLQSPTEAATGSIAGTLRAVLPENEVISFGLQTSAFIEKTWQGSLCWLLVLGRRLLEITATAVVEQQSDEMKSFHVRHVYVPTRDVTATVDFSFPPRRGAPADSVQAVVQIGTKTITLSEPRISAVAITRFVDAIQAATT
jgi:hypothetical protein